MLLLLHVSCVVDSCFFATLLLSSLLTFGHVNRCFSCMLSCIVPCYLVKNFIKSFTNFLHESCNNLERMLQEFYTEPREDVGKKLAIPSWTVQRNHPRWRLLHLLSSKTTEWIHGTTDWVMQVSNMSRIGIWEISHCNLNAEESSVIILSRLSRQKDAMQTFTTSHRSTLKEETAAGALRRMWFRTNWDNLWKSNLSL